MRLLVGMLQAQATSGKLPIFTKRGSCPGEIFRGVDVRKQESWVAEAPQLRLPDVSYPWQLFEQFAHGSHTPVEGCAHRGLYLPPICGAQRVRHAPEIGYDSRDAVGE